MLGSTQVSDGEVLKKSDFFLKTVVGFCTSSIVKLKENDTGLLRVSISEFSAPTCPNLFLSTMQLWAKTAKKQKNNNKKQAESEPADRFCVLDEGLGPLKPQSKQMQNILHED